MGFLLPAALLLLFATWSGNLYGGASFGGMLAGHLALLAWVVWEAEGRRDGLGLGRGAWLPWALWGVVMLGSVLGPVRRAGWVGLLLLPAFLLLPSMVAWAWRERRGRELGLAAVAVTAGVAAAWGLVDRFWWGAPRAAMPLGHHNLQGGWLVILLPLAVYAAWPGKVARRFWSWAARLATVVVAAGVLATGSLSVFAALSAQGLAAVILFARGRRRLLGLVGLAALAGVGFWFFGPRIVSLAQGQDLSWAARSVYWDGAWLGFRQQPWLGWGAGAAAWTAAAFVLPRPGVNPPSEVVGQFHSLPLQLLFEVGLVGTGLATLLIGLFFWRRWRSHTGERALTRAGLLGLLGGLVASLADAWLAITALPLALAVAAGACLVGEARGMETPPRSPVRRRFVRLYGLIALALLLRLDSGVAAYETARRGETQEEVVAALRTASLRDPRFPLYRARLAAQQGGEGEISAWRAASDARGLAPFWLSAGLWETPEAFQVALDVDPLAPAAPYFLALAESPEEGAACLARALLAEPRLLASTALLVEGERLAAAIRWIAGWPGLDAGWKEALLVEIRRERRPSGQPARLRFGVEGAQGGLSIYAFRRLPWGSEWFSETVDREAFEAVDLPAASRLLTSEAGAFPRHRCAPITHPLVSGS